ncbi:MAG: HAD family hydrolase [Planctomycetota bacterium]|jgi:phosphoglycolate phosphatase
MFKAILFDLDGTLLDTLADIANATNFALSELGFPTHPVDSFRYFVGDGIEQKAKRVLPKDCSQPQVLQKVMKLSEHFYRRHWADNTKPYPGIPELLSELRNRNIPMAILSNKPDEFTQLTANKLLAKGSFDIICGIKDGAVRKPDPATAIQIAEKLNIPPRQFIYLGDTDTDMATAVAAGMYPVGALWGFRTADELKSNGAKALLERPQQLLELL